MKKKVEQKQNYERIKEIKTRMFESKPTSFQERQAVMIFEKRKKKKDGTK